MPIRSVLYVENADAALIRCRGQTAKPCSISMSKKHANFLFIHFILFPPKNSINFYRLKTVFKL